MTKVVSGMNSKVSTGKRAIESRSEKSLRFM